MLMNKWLFPLLALGLYSSATHADGTLTPLTGVSVNGLSGSGKYVAITKTANNGGTITRYEVSTGNEETITGFQSWAINDSGMFSGIVRTGSPVRSVPAIVPAGSTTPTTIVDPTLYGAAPWLSNDGHVVGWSGPSLTSGKVPFIWDQTSGIVPLAVPDGVDAGSAQATVISDDGNTIIGTGKSGGATVGILWKAGVPSLLSDDQGNAIVPATVSRNGQFVGGVVPRAAPDISLPQYIWRWSQAGGYEQFLLASAGVKAYAMVGISDDGKTIMGSLNQGTAYPTDGVVWTEAGGTQSIEDYLDAHDVPLPDWWVEGTILLTAMSADGKTFVGSYKPDTLNQYFVAQLSGSVSAAPSLTKRFSPTAISSGDTSTLTITLSNTGSADATLSEPLLDQFPDDLVVADPANEATTCPGGQGQVVANPGVNAIALLAGSIPANGNCTVTVSVTAVPNGAYQNVIEAGSLQTDMGSNAIDAAATLYVSGAHVPAPSATVAPESLDFAVDAGATQTLPLAIGNSGDADLDYSLAWGTASRLPVSSYATARRLAGNVAATWQAASVAAGAKAASAMLDDTSISQMADNTAGTTGASCGVQGAPGTTANSWWRRFYFSEYPQVGATAHVASVTIASGEPGANGVPVSVNLYTIPHSTTVDTIPTAALTPIGSGSGTIDSGYVTATIPVAGDVDDTVAKDLVVEYHIDGAAEKFLPGANGTAETHPSFISAADCGAPEPVQTSVTGATDFHLVMVVHLADSVCQNPSDVPWLSATPTSGTVAPGASADIGVSANASALSAGSYSANLCLTSNDPAHPLIVVPVGLTVAQSPADDGIFCNGFEEGETGACAPIQRP